MKKHLLLLSLGYLINQSTFSMEREPAPMAVTAAPSSQIDAAALLRLFNLRAQTMSTHIEQCAASADISPSFSPEFTQLNLQMEEFDIEFLANSERTKICANSFRFPQLKREIWDTISVLHTKEQGLKSNLKTFDDGKRLSEALQKFAWYINNKTYEFEKEAHSSRRKRDLEETELLEQKIKKEELSSLKSTIRHLYVAAVIKTRGESMYQSQSLEDLNRGLNEELAGNYKEAASRYTSVLTISCPEEHKEMALKLLTNLDRHASKKLTHSKNYE